MKKYMHLILTLAALLLLAACSEVTSPVGPSNDTSADNYTYPPVEDVIANLPAGFRVVNSTSAALDHCDSAVVSRNVRPQGQSLTADALRLVVPTGALGVTVNISIVSANTCLAVADFYPHPYQFNQMVEIRWNLNTLDLPEGYNPADLVPWYVNDAGELIPVEWTLEDNGQTLVIRTDHFSRYIISQRLGG